MKKNFNLTYSLLMFLGSMVQYLLRLLELLMNYLKKNNCNIKKNQNNSKKSITNFFRIKIHKVIILRKWNTVKYVKDVNLVLEKEERRQI
jgi:hypothetical protein